MKFPLRVTIPAVLIIFTFFIGIWSFYANGKIAIANVENERLSDLNADLTVLQGDVEYGLRKNDLGRVKRKISSLRSNDDLMMTFLADEHDKIIIEGQFEYIGKKIEDILPAEKTQREDIQKRIAIIKARLSGETVLSLDRNTAWGIYSIQLGSEEGGLRPTKKGVLVVQTDLSRRKAMALAMVKNQSVQFCLLLGGLMVGLGLIIHFQVARRIQRLVIASESFSEGDLKEPVSVSEGDEISALERSFSEMAKKRAQIEKDLVESENKFRTIFQDAPLGIALIDSLTGQICEANAKYAEIVGRTHRELENLDWMSITHPDDVQEDLDNMARLNAGEIPGFNMRKRYIKPDDSIVWISMTIVPVHLQGEAPRHLCMVKDITSRKESEKKVRTLLNVVEQSPVSVVITDADGNIEYVNASVTNLTGYSEQEILGQKPSLFKSGEMSGEQYKDLWNTVLSGKEWRGVLHNKKKNGELFWESALIFSLKDENENITNFIGLKENISEKKQLESTVVDHEVLIRSVINSLKDGLLIIDGEGRIQMFNRGAESIFEYKAREVMGKNVTIFVPEGSRKAHENGFKQLLETGKSKVFEGGLQVLGRKKDGRVFPMELRVTSILQQGQQLFVGTVRDITNRIEAEKRLETAQRQIIASQKLAAVGELAAGVSHEVLNPVNIISVHTQVLQRKTLNDPGLQVFCTKIRNEINRIQKIMGSLLEFSRKGTAQFERGYLRNDIEKVLALVEDEYKLDNINIIRHWCGDAVELLYDADKMRQVFLNLIHNAKQSMPQGGTITVGCKTIEVSDFHQFTFSDTGVGMSEEVRLRVFEPFFTTKMEGEGTGMGLSIVDGIIEQHGGKIAVESKKDKGTTFTIWLPVAEPECSGDLSTSSQRTG